MFHHLPSVGPKQFCALAYLGCTRKAGTSYLVVNQIIPSKELGRNLEQLLGHTEYLDEMKKCFLFSSYLYT